MPFRSAFRVALACIVIAAFGILHFLKGRGTANPSTSSASTNLTSTGESPRFSSADRALRNKLDPAVDCLNQQLTSFENLEPNYHQRLAALMAPPSKDPFHFDITGFNSNRFFEYDRSIPPAQECANTLDKAAGTSPSVPDFDAAAREDAAGLRAIIEPGRQMDTYLEQKAYLDDHFSKARTLDATLSPLLAKMNKATGQLRAAIHREDAVLDQHWLDAEEKANGRALPWHTQRSMIAARGLNDQLKLAYREDRLDANTAQAAIQPLQTAVDDAQNYIRSHPDVEKPNANGLKPMWFSLDVYFNSELSSARDLRTFLETPPSPNDTPKERREKVYRDFQSVNENFNSLISAYNGDLKSRHPVVNTANTQ